MKRIASLVLLFSGLALQGTAHAGAAQTNVEEALRVARAKQLPVLIDFWAVWCHSCHAMDAKVLNGPEWAAAQSRFVLVRSDADSVNGSAWIGKLHVVGLPSFVVLNPDGSERGQMVGEVQRATFYRNLDGLLSGKGTLTALEADAARGSVAALIAALRAYDDRDQAQVGVRWFDGLPARVRKAAEADTVAGTWLEVVQADAAMSKALSSHPRLSAAERTQLETACRLHARQALRGQLEIDNRFDTADTLLECAQELSPAKQKAVATAQLPALKALYDTKVATADDSGLLRDATYTLAFYYETAGDSAAEKATYARAIAIGRKALDDGHGRLDVKRDEAMADVYGEFLHKYGSQSEDIALRKAMVAAYPDNFFYQSEYGDSLLQQGSAAAALPYLQRAANDASTENELAITHSLAKALIALDRRPEAEKLFNAALHVAEKEFPKKTKRQMAYWKKTGSAL